MLIYLILFSLLNLLFNNGEFHLYHSRITGIDEDHDFLDVYATPLLINSMYADMNREEHYIISFCRRDQLHDELTVPEENQIQSFTFENLKKQNITGDHFYQWSSSLDLIEQYVAFLQDNETGNSLLRFYNCSSAERFGQYCEYFFKSQVSTIYI